MTTDLFRGFGPAVAALVLLALASPAGAQGSFMFGGGSAEPPAPKSPQNAPPPAASAPAPRPTPGPAPSVWPSTAPPTERSAADLAAECDRLAASPIDPDRPPAVAGVALDRLKRQVAAALQACTAAIAANGTDGRLRYQRGRAFEAGGDVARALEYYVAAARLGSVAAAYGAARLRDGGPGHDLLLAREMYRAANRGPGGRFYPRDVKFDEAHEFLDANFECNKRVKIEDDQKGRRYMKTYNSYIGGDRELIFYIVEADYFTDMNADVGYHFRVSAYCEELSPDVGVDGDEIELRCRKPGCITLTPFVPSTNSWRPAEESERFAFRFCSAETASRVAKALSFMITENGGVRPRF